MGEAMRRCKNLETFVVFKWKHVLECIISDTLVEHGAMLRGLLLPSYGLKNDTIMVALACTVQTCKQLCWLGVDETDREEFTNDLLRAVKSSSLSVLYLGDPTGSLIEILGKFELCLLFPQGND